MNRRDLMKLAMTGTTVALTQKIKAAQNCLLPTKDQTEGPFYPEDWQNYEFDADMTRVGQNQNLAQGQIVNIAVQVIDSETCMPLSKTQVDIWQANIFGQYHHENDTLFEDLKDQNFQYRSRIFTNDQGRLQFKTIKPAAYPVGNGWVRPPHIHFKVESKNHIELITQMYFKDDSLNDLDRILLNMNESERQTVIVDFKEVNKELFGTFIISLKSK